MNALKQEWELKKPLLKGLSLKSIYFGGGTPALLGPQRIEEILSWILPSSSIEITLEANPENVTLDTLKAYHCLGINRLSLGIQSFDSQQLRILSRIHDHQRALQTIENASKAGFDNISIDLMYDVPNQTLESWKATLSHLQYLPIQHLSLYNLTIEPHTVYFKKKKGLESSLPNSELSLALLETALESLNSFGLKRYEISAFAREGFFSKHNVGYWTGRPFLGFGPSAFSYWDRSRFRNCAHLNRYCQSLEEQKDPVDFKETLPSEDHYKELLAVRLRLFTPLYFKDWYPLDKDTLESLEEFSKREWVTLTSDYVILTEKGALYYDTIGAELIHV